MSERFRIKAEQEDAYRLSQRRYRANNKQRTIEYKKRLRANTIRRQEK
jgi:hypothetical protein